MVTVHITVACASTIWFDRVLANNPPNPNLLITNPWFVLFVHVHKAVQNNLAIRPIGPYGKRREKTKKCVNMCSVGVNTNTNTDNGISPELSHIFLAIPFPPLGLTKARNVLFLDFETPLGLSSHLSIHRLMMMRWLIVIQVKSWELHRGSYVIICIHNDKLVIMRWYLV
jgi:hypothetical protein